MVEWLRWWGDGCDGEATIEVVMAAGGMVLGGGDVCDGDNMVRDDDGGGFVVWEQWWVARIQPKSGRKKVERRRKIIRKRVESVKKWGVCVSGVSLAD
ncbi:hypothetical protein Tco_0593686 [Tanacetum coccineum]